MSHRLFVLAFLLLLASPATDEDIRAVIARQQKAVELFFGEPMPRKFEVHIFANRPEMNAFAKRQWDMEELPRWAVAMGTGSTLAVLSPGVWKTDAIEHDPSDRDHVEKLITHEMVHVFHGQKRPDDPEFNKADEIGWFVEGLAVHSSGQLDEKRMKQARDVVAAGRAPARLADAWSGNARYAVAGSMVRHVEERLGREKLKALLPVSTNREILGALGMSEAEFIDAWKASLAAK